MKVENINGMKVTTLDNGTVIKEAYSEPAAPTFTDLQNAKFKALNAWFDDALAASIEKYAAGEIESFPYKEKEAQAWRLDNNAPTPTIDNMALKYGKDRVVLILAVLAKVDYRSLLEGDLLALRERIELANSQEELEAIVW